MNANRRFVISLVAYMAYFVLVFIGLGSSSSFQEAAQSLLPGLPGWAGAPLVGLLVVWPLPILFYFSGGADGWKKQVERHGRLASAQVIAVKDGPASNGSTSARVHVDLAVRVMPADEPAFVGGVEMQAAPADMPAPGEVIMVRYDPANHRHIAPVRKMAGAATNRSMGTQSTVVAQATALDMRLHSATISELAGKLRELDEQHQSGSLSDQEFRTARKRLLA